MLLSKNILCFFPVVGDTKDAKRVDILQKAGYNVTVVAFKRDYFISRLPDCEIIIIGKIENRKYFKRIGIMIISLLKLRKIIKRNSVIYALSPDLAFMAFIASLNLNKPIIMDVADIREIQVSKSIFGRLTRVLDKFIAKRCELIVVTSEAFIKEYYSKTIKVSVRDYYLLENKVDYSIKLHDDEQLFLDRSKIRIGYFGVLRDNWTVEFLIGLLKNYPDKFEVLLAGINMIDKFDICKLSNVEEGFSYFGPFTSPNDLLALYNSIDVIALFYPEHSTNVDWFNARKNCRTNRFYEACYFRKPLIAFSFSEDGKKVEELNIGLTVKNYNLTQAVETISKNLTNNQISKWVGNIKKFPVEVYKFKNEPAELKNKIDKILLNL